MIPYLAGRPLPIFPCYPNKRPASANGFKDATTDPERIATLWNGRTGLLVAVPTGEASGIAVLDIDEAGLAWAGLAELPPTRCHVTRSGGRHFIFRHRAGLRCSQSAIADGVDVRAEGGYAIWWSAHGYAVSGAVLAEWPASLSPCSYLRGIQAIPPNESDAVGSRVSNGVASTENPWGRTIHLTERLSKTRPGSRGRTLNFVAVVFGNMIAEGCLSWIAAERCMMEACKANGLWQFDGERAVRREIERGLGYGIEQQQRCKVYEL